MSVEMLEPPVETVERSGQVRRRLLLIAYNFPPVGGAGVQRPVKWAKYLRQFGWDVTVLTTLNPSVPVRDESLLSDLPPETIVVRAKTFEPDYRVKQNLLNASASPSSLARMKGALRGFARQCVKMVLQPDPQVLWNHHAIRAGIQTLRERPHDAILVTAPAYSSFFIGATLKKRFGLPLVLDYRDEWDLSGKYLENAQRDLVSRVVQEQMQRRLLRRADAVVATTRRSTQALADRLHLLGCNTPSQCIYNGFDADDFSVDALQTPGASTVEQPRPGVLRLVYTGTLWKLTDIDPLVRGIEQLAAQQPNLANRLELVCVGRKTPDQQAALDRLQKTPTTVRRIDYCDHTTALQWLQSAHALCLLLSDVPGADRVVPAKMFEYLAARRDILSISPQGETMEIIRRFFPDSHFTPDQTQSIADWLVRRIVRTDSAPVCEPGRDSEFYEYSRESQTGRLAALLNSLVTRPIR